MKYLFILGRNPELSVAELKSFFRKTENGILGFEQKSNAVLVDLEEPLEAGVVEFLGGTIGIGRVLCELKNIDRTEIYYSEKNNFSYVVWNFSDSAEEIREYLKSRFKKERLKASEKNLGENMFLQGSEDKSQRLSSKTVEEQYFVFGDYFGKIVEFSDYKEIEKRDMEKPVRRESLSISPRLAKIMINLSEVPSGGEKILLDGFCGIGVVLIEALNQEIKVVGVDSDDKAILGAKENLKHFGFHEDNYKLINKDSSKVDLSKFKKISGMASEPDFGETLKKIPTKERAELMVEKFEKLMSRVLSNVKSYIPSGGKIVLTFPYIRTIKKRVGCDVKKIALKTGLKVSEGFPLDEFRKDQIVGRQIVVFEKQ
jgi:tRNA G10  N-methylase Trm11